MVLIRESMSLSALVCLSAKRPPRPCRADECDPRHGSYDFYAEQMAAPDDLKFLTDQASTKINAGHQANAINHIPSSSRWPSAAGGTSATRCFKR